jgi:hypothetical protein
LKISVYITSYNQRRYLPEAIESVLSQTLRSSEIIIVDDCSTDGSQEVIAGYASRYPDLILPIYHAQNRGVSPSRVDALRAATGDYVTYVDGDDRFLPAKLESETRLLRERAEAQIAFSNFYYTGEEGEREAVWAEDDVPPEGNVFQQAFARAFPRGDLFRCELVAVRCLRNVGGYDESLQTHEDWDLKIRLTKRYRVAYCPQPLLEYRRNPAGLSCSSASARLESIRKVHEKNRHLLSDLPRAKRAMIEEAVALKLGQMARKASEEERRSGNRVRALRFWLDSLIYAPADLDFGLTLRLFLPQGAYMRLSRVFGHMIREA